MSIQALFLDFYHGIQVDEVLTSEDVRSYKPRSELFEEALRRYHLKSNEVLHVGDSLVSDVCGVQQVGIKAVWLNRQGKNLSEHIVPDYITSDLFELRQLIAQKQGIKQ